MLEIEMCFAVLSSFQLITICIELHSMLLNAAPLELTLNL